MEFIERFLWHVLPQGLRRIRRFGWWGNAVRTDKLAVLRKLLRLRPAAVLGIGAVLLAFGIWRLEYR